MSTVEGKQPENDDFNLLNSEISEMLQRTLLVHEGGNFEWGWKFADNDLDQILWPILSSATELLSSAEIERIGICEGDGCGWFFYDNSRNHSRKWCDTGDCGNRAKARCFYKKKMGKIRQLNLDNPFCFHAQNEIQISVENLSRKS